MFFWKRGRSNAGKRPTLSVAGQERVYAIGDVHGRLDLLVALVDKIERDALTRPPGRRARLIFLGDYIDRGDQSREVVDCLIRLRDRLCDRVDFLAGNHEASLLGFLDDPLRGRDWLQWGGRQTMASYGVVPPSDTTERADLDTLSAALRRAMGEQHIGFLRGLSGIATSGSVVFVHAGLDPSLPLDRQPDAAMLWGRIGGERTSGLPGYRMVHGHFAADAPVSLPERVCVDTGAYYSGRLTAVRLDEEEAFLDTDGREV